MAYQKDSMIIIVQAGEDGYFSSYHIYNQSPPPIPRMYDMLGSVEDVPDGPLENRQDRISADKTALKTEIGQAIDSFFDV